MSATRYYLFILYDWPFTTIYHIFSQLHAVPPPAVDSCPFLVPSMLIAIRWSDVWHDDMMARLIPGVQEKKVAADRRNAAVTAGPSGSAAAHLQVGGCGGLGW